MPPPSDTGGPVVTGLEGVMTFLAGAFRREDAVWEDAAVEAACAVHVTGNERLSPDEQVDIYRRQFWLRHVDSLVEDYPGLQHVLGKNGFDAFARAYLTACPPRAPSLRDLGADLPLFAERYDGFGEQRAIALDMLRYEHAFVDLFDGADVPRLDPQKLATMPEDGWERARLVLHPLLVRLRLDFPVNRLRSSIKRGDEDLAIPGPETTHVVLYREDFQITYKEIDATAFRLLDELARGTSLVRACEVIAESGEASGEELEQQVGAWFQAWTADHWLVDVELR